MSNLVPMTVQDALAVASQLAQSGMVPRDYACKPGAIFAAMDLGASVGLRPMQAVQGIASINGRPALWGDAALGVVMAHPSFESIDEDDASKAAAQGFGRCRVVRKGSPPYEVRFTVDMAKAAGLWGKAGPWSAYAGRMLQMRARSWAFRDRFPDALKGIRIAEEAQDTPADAEPVPSMMPTAVDATATVVEAPAAAPYTPPPRTEARKVPANCDRVPVRIDGAKLAASGEKDGRKWNRYEVALTGPDGSFVAVTFSDTLGPEMENAAGMDGVAVLKRDAQGRINLYDMEAAP